MESPTDNNGTAKPTSILVVDDDPALRKLLVTSLQHLSYLVREARSGGEGLALAREHRPDLVLLDVVLGDVNGVEVCRQIKADPALRGTFVLLMSGLAIDLKSEVGGRESGADDYLIKPFHLPLLQARLRSLERIQRVEAALRESEAKYRNLIEHIPVIAYTAALDKQGSSLFASGQIERMLGFTRDEWLADPALWSKRLHPEDCGRVLAGLQRCTERGEEFRAEYRILHRDGRVLWFQDQATFARDTAGQPIGLHGVALDITQRKQAETRASALSSLGRDLNSATTLKAAAQIIVAVADNLWGWDACAVDLLAPGSESARTVLLMDRLEGQRLEVPRTAPGFSPFAHSVMRDGPKLILRGSPFTPSPDLLAFGDTARPSASLMFVPIRNGSQVIGVLSIQSYTPNAYTTDDLSVFQVLADYCGGAFQRIQAGEDLAELNRTLEQRVAERTTELETANRALADEITERECIEASLRESEERYRSLIAALQEGIVLQDASGVVRACNASAERMLGLHADQMVPAFIDPRWQAIHEDGAPFLEEAHPTTVALGTGQRQSNVIMGLHKPDGCLTWISINAEPILQPGEARPSAVVTSFVDITERKQAAETLRSLPERILRAQEAERKRVARELHDGVGQLLASVRFRLRGLEAKLAAGGLLEFSRDLGRMQEHLEQAVEEVRRVSRNLRPGELDDLGFLPAINSACAEFTARTGIQVNMESTRLPARLSPEMELALYRIVQEALTNIERHAQAANVTLRLTQMGSQLLLSVSDDGRGFAPDGAQTNRSGLGLVNTRERAAHLGGKTWIKSQPGSGTEITVRIPLDRAGQEKSDPAGQAGVSQSHDENYNHQNPSAAGG